MHKRVVTLLSILLLCASCQKFAEGRQLFRDILALRDQVAAEFHETVGNVNVSNGQRVTITFIDSPLNSASQAAKQQRADAVAAFVMSHYKHPVSSVVTSFTSQKGPISFSESFVGRPAPQQ
jgi:hypothetical protein